MPLHGKDKYPYNTAQNEETQPITAKTDAKLFLPLLQSSDFKLMQRTRQHSGGYKAVLSTLQPNVPVKEVHVVPGEYHFFIHFNYGTPRQH